MQQDDLKLDQPNRRAVADKDYAAFRDSISRGTRAAPYYSKLLTAALAKVDHFFGDDPSAAASMDRVLSLAIAYPILSLFGVYWFTGSTGPAEQSLGLVEGLSFWTRGLQAVGVVMGIFGVFWLYRSLLIRRRFIFQLFHFVWFCSAGVRASATMIAGAGTVAVVIALSLAFAGALAGTVTIAVALKLALAIAVILAGSAAGVSTGAAAGAFALATYVEKLNDRSAGLGWWFYFPILLIYRLASLFCWQSSLF